MNDPGAAEAEYATRRLDREGIPVLLTLHDETGTAAPVTDPALLAEGAAYADLLAEYRAVLRPDAADDDQAALYDVLAVVAWVHRSVPPGSTRTAEGGSAATFSGQLAALRAGRFLRVINYHDTPPGTEDELTRELAAYLDRYDPVTPSDLGVFLDTGRWPGRPGFAAAFYDGYRNHATVAAPVCDRLGLRAWFLPPTGFLAAPSSEQAAYTDRYDFWMPVAEPGGRLALTWSELAAIGQRHEIVAHTATHAPADQVAADPDGELIAPRRVIAEVTGRAPEAVVFRLGAPWDGSPLVPDAGYRWLLSNTAIQRLPSEA